MLLEPDATAVLDQQIISAFWERYTPLNANARGGSACIWLEQVIWLPDPGEALRLSIKAFAMTRLGWLNNDRSLALQGNMCYNRALQSVQQALWQESTAMNDEIFVAGYVLAVVEVILSH